MTRIHRLILFASLIFVFAFTDRGQTSAQNRRVTHELSTLETGGPQASSATGRILRNLAKAVIEALCAEYGDCNPNSSPPTETTAPESRENERYLTPGFGGANTRLAPQPRGFSFDTPQGWQAYENQLSVTVARSSEYVNGNLTNGVILGLFDLKDGSFESANEKYVRGLLSNNKYLKRMGWGEATDVNNVPCITTRMEGQSPQTQYFEKVVVYTCKRNARKLFYVVTVNSGPNASRYEEENSRLIQTISFTQ